MYDVSRVYDAMLTLHGALIIILAIASIIGAGSLRKLRQRIERLEQTFERRPNEKAVKPVKGHG